MKAGIGIAAATLALAATAAWADTTDLVIHCDPPLERPLRDIAAAFLSRNGVALRIFPTPPNGIPELLARDIQNDIVVTGPDGLARIGAMGRLSDLPPSARWRNRLVIAAKRGGNRKPIEQETLAAPDPVWGGGPDGPAVLAAAGLHPGKTLGTYGTGEARTLLLAGEVTYALLYASELNDALEEVPAPGLPALDIAAAINKNASRPNPEAVLKFLASPEAIAILRARKLEPVA